ncbi:Myb-like dna-binding protein, partial [Globisporangium splendens]
MNNAQHAITSDDSTRVGRGVWTTEEHDKFLVGLKAFPEGPWKAIADHVGTRSARQVQTHAQKYYEKVARRVRGLRKDRKKVVRSEHRIDEALFELRVADKDAAALASRGLKANVRMSPSTSSSSKPSHSTGAQVNHPTPMTVDDSCTSGDSDSSLHFLDEDCLNFLIAILDSQELGNSSPSS